MKRKRPKPGADFAEEQAARMRDILWQRATLDHEDLEYVVERISKLKDQRLQACVAELIGWSDDDRAELETFIAIAYELMKRSTVSRIRECATIVELRHYMKEMKHDGAKGAENSQCVQTGPDVDRP